MATLQELETQVKAAEKVVADLDVQLTNPKLTDAEYDALREKRNDANDVFIDLKNKRDQSKKTKGVTETNLKNSQDFAKNQIDIFESRARDAVAEFNKNPSGGRDKLKAAYDNLNTAYDDADALGLKVPRIIEPTQDGGFVLAGQQPVATTMRGSEALAGEKQTGAAASAVVGKEDLTTTVKNKVTVVKGGNNVEVTTYMDGRVSEKVLGPSTLPDTPTSAVPKGTSKKTTPAKPIAPVADNSWEQLFIQNNPSKAWYLTELDRTKYPQLFAVIQEYAKDRPLTIEEKNAYDAKLEGTDFVKELTASGKVREIKNVVGELGFDSTDFTKFVHTAINMGYTGDRLKQETYKEVFKTGADGKYVNPTALARASKSADYLNVVNTARSYFNTAGANQASVQSVLTGGITTEDFQRQQREIAKKRYPHLADLIDQGVSLESLAGNFQTTAAKLLEVDPNTIDMSAADYEVALNFGEEGKKRVMTTGEWDKLLRTDSRYGWEKTNNAKQEARGLAANLVQAFGRII
jgi:hypothetical protein